MWGRAPWPRGRAPALPCPHLGPAGGAAAHSARAPSAAGSAGGPSPAAAAPAPPPASTPAAAAPPAASPAPRRRSVAGVAPLGVSPPVPRPARLSHYTIVFPQAILSQLVNVVPRKSPGLSCLSHSTIDSELPTLGAGCPGGTNHKPFPTTEYTVQLWDCTQTRISQPKNKAFGAG